MPRAGPVQLEEELKAAIFNGDLIAHYQPMMNLETYQVAGFEVLVRWPHPERGLVHPVDFVPFAEEIGLIGEIDAFVLRTACRQVRQWQEAGLCGPELDIGVNLSAGQLADPALSHRTRPSRNANSTRARSSSRSPRAR